MTSQLPLNTKSLLFMRKLFSHKFVIKGIRTSFQSPCHFHELHICYTGRFSEWEHEFQMWGLCATFRDIKGQIWVTFNIFRLFA